MARAVLAFVLSVAAAAACADPGAEDRAALARSFEYVREPFPSIKTRTLRFVTYDEYRVEMPSALETGTDANNTIYGFYYRPRARTGAAVIVLPIANGRDLSLEKTIAIYLAHRGFRAFVMPMPYQQDRGKGADAKNVLGKVQGEAGVRLLREATRQAVLDVKRVRQWLVEKEKVNPERVGLVGVSLGSLCASITYSIDPDFRAAALVLSGGDMAEVIWHGSKETAKIKNALLAEGKDLAWTREAVRPVDPLTYATPERGKGIYMVNADADEVFPQESTRKLRKAYGDPPILMLPGNHYSVAIFSPIALEAVARHLREHLLGKRD